MIVADLEQVEEWNEFDEIKQELGGEGKMTTAGMVKSVAAGAASKGGVSSPAVSTSKGAETAKTDAGTASTIQNLQAKQQSSLAVEAAAVAAARKKAATASTGTSSTSMSSTPVKSADPLATSTSTVRIEEALKSAVQIEEPPTIPTTESDPNTTVASTEPKARSSTLPTAEQDSVDAFTSSSPPTHNTSATTGLPALSLRTNPTSPPSTAQGILNSTADTTHATSPQATKAREESIDAELPSGKIAEEGAAPSAKSGLDAVTSNPEGMATAMETGKMDGGVAEQKEVEHEGKSENSAAEKWDAVPVPESGEVEPLPSNAEDGAAEKENVVPASQTEDTTGSRETDDKGETAEKMSSETESKQEDGLGTEGEAQKVKFEEDQEKGDAIDEVKAQESVLD